MNHILHELEPTKLVPEPQQDSKMEATTIRLTLLESELAPNDQNNRAESDVPQQQLSPFIDVPTPQKSPLKIESQVNLRPSLSILPNCTTRRVPRVSYEPILTSIPEYPINNYVSYHSYQRHVNYLQINCLLYIFLTLCKKP